MTANHGPSVTVVAAEIAGVAILWVALFQLNGWLFESFEFTQHVNWVFLPAAVRVAAVLLFGISGAVGLFVGSLITSSPELSGGLSESLLAAAVSALAPLTAVHLVRLRMGISADLHGLSFGQLAVMSIAGAALSALAHTVLYTFQAGELGRVWGLFPMFAGDLLGTLIIVYAVHFVLRFGFPTPPQR